MSQGAGRGVHGGRGAHGGCPAHGVLGAGARLNKVPIDTLAACWTAFARHRRRTCAFQSIGVPAPPPPSPFKRASPSCRSACAHGTIGPSASNGRPHAPTLATALVPSRWMATSASVAARPNARVNCRLHSVASAVKRAHARLARARRPSDGTSSQSQMHHCSRGANASRHAVRQAQTYPALLVRGGVHTCRSGPSPSSVAR